MTRKPLPILVALSALVMLGAGCSTMPTDQHAELVWQAMTPEAWARTPRAATPAPAYRLQVGDVIDVRFPRVSELNETVTLRPDGQISMVWVGEVQAAGLTPTELATALRLAYRDVLRKPQIDVLVRTFQPQRVYVAGEVARPGEQPLLNELSALQAIVRSGDFTPDAERDTVVVIRQNGREPPDFIVLDFSNSEAYRRMTAAEKPCSESNPLACDGVKPLRAESFLLQPMDLVFVAKTPLAGVAQFFERYVNQILPVYRNMGLTWNYQLNWQKSVITVAP